MYRSNMFRMASRFFPRAERREYSVDNKDLGEIMSRKELPLSHIIM